MPGGAGQFRNGGYSNQHGGYEGGNLHHHNRYSPPGGGGPGSPAAYDGPGSDRMGSGPGSPHHGSQGHGSPRPPMSPGNQSQHGSRAGTLGPGGPGGFPQGLGYDPARISATAANQSTITNRRVEYPSAAYRLNDRFHSATELPARPGLNSAGKVIQVRLNQFKITQIPTQNIYQYDVMVGSGAEKRGLVMVAWKSAEVQSRLRELSKGAPWLWNGDKIAWCAAQVPEQRWVINLDHARGRSPRAGGEPDIVRVQLKGAKIIKMTSLYGFLSRQSPFDDGCLEGINFLDHLIRQGPSEQYTTVKRSFFAQGERRHALDNVVEAMRGVYSSIRLCELASSVGGPGTGLALNVDVANGTFWASQDVHQAARNLCKARNRNLSYTIFRDLLLPVKDGRGGFTRSVDFKELSKMGKLKFRVKHRGKEATNKDYIIKRFTSDTSAKFAQSGIHAKNKTFMLKHRNGNVVVREEEITVYDYFMKKYSVRLEFWYLPLIETTRDGLFPMEVCILNPNQRYQYKLSPDQTASMIKFAVTRPKERLAAIKHGVGMLKWNQDPYLGHFGLRVDPSLTTTQARLLPPAEVQYNGSKATPGYSGRWDLRGKKFFASNPEPLASWGVCVVNGCTNQQTVTNFLSVFIQTYIGHGGKNKQPVIHIMGGNDTLPQGVEATRMKAGNQANAEPQILLFVLPGRDSFMYERLKRNMECRFAMVSQMLNINHVQKAAPQYCSNVCMKLNSKLGGTTSKIVFAPNQKMTFPVPTMIIGADVSHPGPGSQQPSMAAITMSFDRDACRYAAACETNGRRVEMITEANIYGMFLELYQKWMFRVGGRNHPKHIYYFRDGVSEGQYEAVLKQEVGVMKKALAEKLGPDTANIKWTVTIAGKRHHIRFFPKDGDNVAGDKNGNPVPGILVERDVTHPFEYDFYLNSHSAIQGTARPVHYHVLLDEAQCNINEFQRMIYNHSYQYARSTTPVSIFPAIYYAHLASNRARAHDNSPASDGPKGGQKFEEAQQDANNRRIQQGTAAGSSQTGDFAKETVPLTPMGVVGPGMNQEKVDKIRCSMWYI